MGQSDAQRFTAQPAPSLRPFVVEYWAGVRDLAAMGGFTITPDRFGELICSADPIDFVEADGRHRLSRCFLVGLLDSPMRIESAGVVRFMAARLQPWSLGRLAERLGGEQAGPWRDAGGLFDDDRPRVTGLVAARCWTTLAGIFDRTLGDIYAGYDPRQAAVGMAAGFALGSPPTSAVARVANVSRRQVERRVRGVTSLSPKRLACLARFQRARDAIWSEPMVDLAELAARLGYADQPHMTRHFKRYAGMTPGEFARDSKRGTDGPGRGVAFVQDEHPGGP